jgi:hypothetical protein
MLTSITNSAAFFLAATIPIPALRALCIMVRLIIMEIFQDYFHTTVLYMLKKPQHL